MEGMNRVILFGNLGADPELHFTQGGSAVLNLRIATTESYLNRDKQRQERTEWSDVVVWGKRAEALSKFLRKGASLLVEGRLETQSYEDRDGSKRYRTKVIAQNVVLGPRGSGARDTESSGGSGGGGGARAPQGQSQEFGEADGGLDGDIPFGSSAPGPRGL